MLDHVALSQIVSMHSPFFSRPLSVWCFDNVFSSSVCVFSLYSPYSSFRTFFSIAWARAWLLPAPAGRGMAAPVVSIHFQDGADLSPFLRLLLLLLLHRLRLSTFNGKDSPAVEFCAPSSSSHFRWWELFSFLVFSFRFVLFCFVFLFFSFSLSFSLVLFLVLSLVCFPSPSCFLFLFVFLFIFFSPSLVSCSLPRSLFVLSRFFLFRVMFSLVFLSVPLAFLLGSSPFSFHLFVCSLFFFFFWVPFFFFPLLLAIIFSLFPLSVSFPFSLFPCFTPCVFRGFISCLDYHRMIIDIGFRCRFAYRVFIMQLSLSFCVFAFLSRVNVSSTRLYLVLIIYFRYNVFSVIADF